MSCCKQLNIETTFKIILYNKTYIENKTVFAKTIFWVNRYTRPYLVRLLLTHLKQTRHLKGI